MFPLKIQAINMVEVVCMNAKIEQMYKITIILSITRKVRSVDHIECKPACRRGQQFSKSCHCGTREIFIDLLLSPCMIWISVLRTYFQKFWQLHIIICTWGPVPFARTTNNLFQHFKFIPVYPYFSTAQKWPANPRRIEQSRRWIENTTLGIFWQWIIWHNFWFKKRWKLISNIYDYINGQVLRLIQLGAFNVDMKNHCNINVGKPSQSIQRSKLPQTPRKIEVEATYFTGIHSCTSKYFLHYCSQLLQNISIQQYFFYIAQELEL